jgi:hypothetical protein
MSNVLRDVLAWFIVLEVVLGGVGLDIAGIIGNRRFRKRS